MGICDKIIRGMFLYYLPLFWLDMLSMSDLTFLYLSWSFEDFKKAKNYKN